MRSVRLLVVVSGVYPCVRACVRASVFVPVREYALTFNGCRDVFGLVSLLRKHSTKDRRVCV